MNDIPDGFELVESPIPDGFEIVEPAKQTPEKSFLQGVSDFVTGNDRATEQTDSLPELSESNGLFYGEDKTKVAAVLPALLTTLDTEGIQNIITNNFENIGVTYNKDAQGNVFPILRNNKTGAVAQINRAGLSKMDILQGLGLAAAFTPAGRAGASAAGTLGAAARVGLASGATQAGLNAYQQAQGRGASIEDIGAEVGFAGLGGAVFETMFRTLGPIAKNIFNRVRGGQIDDTAREMFIEQATRLGVNPDDVTDDFIRKAANDASSAFDPTNAKTPLEREFNVTLSNAQRSGNQAALSSDDSIRAGLRGGKAQEIFLKSEANQLDELGRASASIQEDIARGAETLSNRQQAGSALSEGVRVANKTAQAAKDEAYNAVGDALLEPGDFKAVLQKMRKSVTGVEFDRALPETKKMLDGSKGIIKAIDSFGDQLKPYHIKQIENYRKRLNASINNADYGKPDFRQLTIMKQSFDDSLDDAVAQGLFKGDQGSLDALKTARSLNADYSRKFLNPESTIIQKIVRSNPTDEEVINSLFTASGFNKAGAANLAKSYKQILGADSDAWNMVRQAAFKQLIKTDSSGAISGAKTLTSLNKALEQNRSLINELFTAEEFAKIRRFSALLKRAQPDLVRSRENPSGTAQKLGKEMANSLLPWLDNGLLTVTAGTWKIAKNRAGANAARQAFRPFEAVSRGAASTTVEAAGIGQSERIANSASNLF